MATGAERGLYHFWRALLLFAVVLAGSAAPAFAADDNENSTPTAWWISTGQSVDDINNTIDRKNARIIDIAADDSSFGAFTATYVHNTGSYAKSWWWYENLDAATLGRALQSNNARLISLEAYDTGGGNIRFVAAMIANTGADNKAWWWYYGQSPAQLAKAAQTNNARLTSLRSYASGGQTYYTAIMIANTGSDAKGWWWYYNASPQTIAAAISSNKARLLDLTPAGGGNFNATMETCGKGCPAWWWYYGLTASQVLTEARNDGARAITFEPYAGCGSSSCFAVVFIGNTPADVTACDSQGCISEAKLQNRICGTLANHVVGYSCLVGALRPVSGGLARTAVNPPSTPMAPSLVTDIASVSKTMTAVGIIQLLHRDGLTIDTRISSYIYSDWRRGPNIDKLTFKNLLTHTSGFGQLPNSACANDITYSAVETVVARGVKFSNIGKPSYGNCNFALLRELMPALLHEPLTGIANGQQRAKKSSALYIGYMRSHVFEPVGAADSSCTPPSDTSGILSYPYPALSASGTDWGDWSLECGSGGWVLSASDIFDVVDDLANGSTLLTAAEKKQMFAGCLGWDCAVRSDCPDPYVCKNGDLSNGSGISVWTYAGVFKCRVPVVVVVNSPLPAPYQGGEDIIGLVKDAYADAAVAGTPAPCK